MAHHLRGQERMVAGGDQDGRRKPGERGGDGGGGRSSRRHEIKRPPLAQMRDQRVDLGRTVDRHRQPRIGQRLAPDVRHPFQHGHARHLRQRLVRYAYGGGHGVFSAAASRQDQHKRRRVHPSGLSYIRLVL